MRVYRRHEFLKLPPGTIFCAGAPYLFGGMSIKFDTLPSNDYVRLGLQWIEAADSGEAIERLDAMLESGASYALQESAGRDGGFNAREVYLVYEEADLLKLIEYCRQAIAAQESAGKSATPGFHS